MATEVEQESQPGTNNGSQESGEKRPVKSAKKRKTVKTGQGQALHSAPERRAGTPEYPPFMNAYGNVGKILQKIKEAKTPDRFTQDFLSTVLGFPGGGARPFIPVAKRLGLLAADGAPTEIYRRFRNPDQAKAAMAEAIRRGYPTLFARNQYADRLDKKKLEGLIMEATGLDADAPTLRAISSTFEALKAFADFEAPGGGPPTVDETQPEPTTTLPVLRLQSESPIGLSYTINLNLPNTTDIAVFNAIFKSLRDNLLPK